MQKGMLRLLGLGLLLGFIGLAFAQGPSDGKKNPFYASAKPISAYISGVDYSAGEVLVVVPPDYPLTEEKLKQITDSKKINALQVSKPVQLAPTNSIDSKVCGGKVIKLSFDPNQPLTDALLEAIQQGLVDVGDLGDFTEAPNEGGGKPSLPTTPNPVPKPTLNRTRAASYEHDASKMVVAVIDSGVTTNVPGVTLAPQVNFTGGVGTPAAFDDNFVFNAPNPPTPWLGHGTQVSGIIAGPPTNSPGTGIAQNATIMPLQPCDANRTCKGLDVLAAICYAASPLNEVQKPAEVINLSLGSFIGSRTIENAVLDARDAGSVVVMSAGNSRNPEWGIPVNTLPAGLDPDVVKASRLALVNDPVYPAAFSNGYLGALDGLISVGSVVNDSNAVALSKFSTWNSSVDFVTAGEKLDLFRPNGLRDTDHKGTSFSAPFVAAMAAVLMRIDQTLTPLEVEEKLRSEVMGMDVLLSCGGSCGTFPPNTSFMVKKLHVGMF
jgi:hypothetical protein